ncbi:hypothetical protein C5167_025411 [Papaver somniferum]|uniref:Uncharacterized protein n=1 Tax=Papaver somniferum TaxID=3469 RepID=A0A4Y7JUD3_PAPSO|nr:cation/H(+) antiporter 15-like [Papaver somniferum]RZC63650.1 hypothetical protein C5167_025411 [Papaver somniferum]
MKIARLVVDYQNGTIFYCGGGVYDGISSIWNEDDSPFDYLYPVFSMQIVIASFFTSFMKWLLEPLGQTSLTSHVIGGIMAGPSCFGRTDLFSTKLFLPNSMYMFDNCQYFGSMFFLFLIGVKTDLHMLTRSGKKAWFIGFCVFIVPLFFNLSASQLLDKSIKLDNKLADYIHNFAAMMSLSSFHVIACFLDDLQLLSSELGRLAMSASMISGILSWCLAFVCFTIITSLEAKRPHALMLIILACCAMFLCIIFVLRPIMFWIIRNTPNDKNVKEVYVFSIFVMVLLSSLCGEVIGSHFLLGPMVLGMAVPAGPPLGAAIEEKLEFFVKYILLPTFVVACGFRVNIFEVNLEDFIILELIVVVSFIGKLLGTMLPALYCRMPYQDAFLLGLIMNVQGILDLMFWACALGLGLITDTLYTILVLSMLIVTGTISPTVKYLYNPSRRYITYKRRSIQNCKRNVEFRILACIYHDENVPTILDVLGASHPTAYSPICIYVLHLIQLQGRASPLLVAHKSRKISSQFNSSSHIINAFKSYEKQGGGTISVNSFTAISPYTTMHDDICSIASERRSSLIILPFHHNPAFSSSLHLPTSIRKVNQNVLKRAPCSVGLLVDRGHPQRTQISCNITDKIKPTYRVAVIFLGGADDREALSYGARMGEDNNVKLTLFRFSYNNQDEKSNNPTYHDPDYSLDNDCIEDFRRYNEGLENVVYREEEVKDSVEIVTVITSIEYTFDLLIVGKDHDGNSSELLRALEEWNEFPELGVIGDMLSSPDSRCNGSILVVQQQPTSDLILDSPTKYHFGELA